MRQFPPVAMERITAIILNEQLLRSSLPICWNKEVIVADCCFGALAICRSDVTRGNGQCQQLSPIDGGLLETRQFRFLDPQAIFDSKGLGPLGALIRVF
jgi:hypothetical protein